MSKDELIAWALSSKWKRFDPPGSPLIRFKRSGHRLTIAGSIVEFESVNGVYRTLEKMCFLDDMDVNYRGDIEITIPHDAAEAA